jgi:DNA-binding MarR family transcriptional regulator
MAANSKTARMRRQADESFGDIRLDFAERSFYRFSILATQINRCVTAGYVHKVARPANGWKVLTLLAWSGPISATEITGHTSLELDKVTRVLDGLAAQGFVVRKQDRDDRRRSIVHLTPAGRRVVRQIEDMIYRMEREFLIALSGDEREALYAIMDKLQVRAKQLFSGKRPWKRFE